MIEFAIFFTILREVTPIIQAKHRHLKRLDMALIYALILYANAWSPIMLCTGDHVWSTNSQMATAQTSSWICVCFKCSDLQCASLSMLYLESDPLWYTANNKLSSRRLYQREWLVLKRLLRRARESISEEQHLFSSVFCPNILGCGFAANKQMTEAQMEKIGYFNCCQTYSCLTVWRLEYMTINQLSGSH